MHAASAIAALLDPFAAQGAPGLGQASGVFGPAKGLVREAKDEQTADGGQFGDALAAAIAAALGAPAPQAAAPVVTEDGATEAGDAAEQARPGRAQAAPAAAFAATTPASAQLEGAASPVAASEQAALTQPAVADADVVEALSAQPAVAQVPGLAAPAGEAPLPMTAPAPTQAERAVVATNTTAAPARPFSPSMATPALTAVAQPAPAEPLAQVTTATVQPEAAARPQAPQGSQTALYAAPRDEAPAAAVPSVGSAPLVDKTAKTPATPAAAPAAPAQAGAMPAPAAPTPPAAVQTAQAAPAVQASLPVAPAAAAPTKAVSNATVGRSATTRSEAALAEAHPEAQADRPDAEATANLAAGADDDNLSLPSAAPDDQPRDAEPSAERPQIAAAAPAVAESRAVAAPMVDTPRATPQTVALLAAQIAHKVDGKATRFDVQLDPHGLGKVDVRVEITARGEVSAALTFENPDAAAELRGRAAELHTALEQAGFDLSRTSLSFSSGGQGQHHGLFDQQQNQTPVWRGRAFTDLSDTPEAAPAPVLRRAAAGGVDVRI